MNKNYSIICFLKIENTIGRVISHTAPQENENLRQDAAGDKDIQSRIIICEGTLMAKYSREGLWENLFPP